MTWQEKLRAAGYTGELDLDSLIEACPMIATFYRTDCVQYKAGFELGVWDKGTRWRACYDPGQDFVKKLPSFGDTRREAVANLLLELKPWETK